MAKKFSFPRKRKLKSQKEIKELFKKGSSSFLYPFKIFYSENLVPPEDNKVVFSVPKRQFKHAVARNKIKRKMNEAYRLEQAQHASLPERIIFHFVAKKEEDYAFIEKKMKKLLNKLSNDGQYQAVKESK